MSVNFTNNTPYKNFFAQTGTYSPVTSPALQPSSIFTQPASVKVGDIKADTFVINKDGEKEKKKDGVAPKKWVGVISASVGGTLLLGVLTAAALSKGFSGGISKSLTKISDKAKKVIFDLSAKSKDLTFAQKIKLNVSKGIKFTADGMQASSNVTAIKDSFVSHWLDKLGLNKVVNGINKFFRKVTLKTKNNAYKQAEYSVVDFCNYLKTIAKEQKNPALERKAEQIMKEYMSGFSSEKYIGRAEDAWKHLDGMDKKVYDSLYKKEGGFFKNLKQLKSYVTTDIIAADKKALQNGLNSTKARISNNITDVNVNMKNALYDLQVGVDSSNNRAVELVKELSKSIDSSKALSGAAEEAQRAVLFKKIQANLDELSKISASTIKDKKALAQMQEKIAKMHELTKPEAYGKGLAQEALTEIKQLCGGRDSNEYKLAKRYMERMNGNMNTAIGHEVNSYEKLAELRVGSAPTDILGILGPAGLAALLVANSKDKDERISKTLTAGIPIIGGIGMSYYGTLRGWTGARNLALGALATWLLNMTGSKTDEIVKNYRTEQNKLKSAFESLTKIQNSQKSSQPIQA